MLIYHRVFRISLSVAGIWSSNLCKLRLTTHARGGNYIVSLLTSQIKLSTSGFLSGISTVLESITGYDISIFHRIIRLKKRSDNKKKEGRGRVSWMEKLIFFRTKSFTGMEEGYQTKHK